MRPQDRNRRLLDELAQSSSEGSARAATRLPDSAAAAEPPDVQPTGSRSLATDLFAGMVVGVVTLTFSISCAALIFSGPLSELLPLGMASALISASMTALIVAWRSSLSVAIAGPDSHGSAPNARGIPGAHCKNRIRLAFDGIPRGSLEPIWWTCSLLGRLFWLRSGRRSQPSTKKVDPTANSIQMYPQRSASAPHIV